jgi:hypothetical protein
MGWNSFEGRAPKVGSLGGNYSLPDIGRFNVSGYAMPTRPGWSAYQHNKNANQRTISNTIGYKKSPLGKVQAGIRLGHSDHGGLLASNPLYNVTAFIAT